MVATTSPTSELSYKDYRTAEFDSARRRGRYYQQLSYKLDREHKHEQAVVAQTIATEWFEVFEAMCDKAEHPNDHEGTWQ